MRSVSDAFALQPRSIDTLARFSIDGVDCIVISLQNQSAIPENSIGTFILNNCEYAIIPSLYDGAGPDLIELLSPRELEIAILIATGYETKQIARRLRISFHTVRVHLGRIYAKLNLHKQTELASRVGAQFGARQLAVKSASRCEPVSKQLGHIPGKQAIRG